MGFLAGLVNFCNFPRQRKGKRDDCKKCPQHQEKESLRRRPLREGHICNLLSSHFLSSFPGSLGTFWPWGNWSATSVERYSIQVKHWFEKKMACECFLWKDIQVKNGLLESISSHPQASWRPGCPWGKKMWINKEYSMSYTKMYCPYHMKLCFHTIPKRNLHCPRTVIMNLPLRQQFYQISCWLGVRLFVLV